jgi:3-hydroxybutyryl-CoA dehydrogenase
MQEVKNVAVIGSGTMGSGIAQIAATAGCKVVLIDTSDVALDKARSGHQKIMNRLVEKGRMTQEKADDVLSKINYHLGVEETCDCQLIIEAIIENIEIKKKLFTSLEKVISPNAIIATNTSSLSVASIAASCEHSNRVVGLHFFNPAPLLPLVEVVPSLLTDKEVAESVFELMKTWGKIPVYAKDTPGFIVNRVARPFYGEALRIYDEGLVPEGEVGFATIDAALKTQGGFRMGPFELMDLIGNDINYTVTETVFREFYFDPRYKPSFTQKRMKEAGFLGRKTKKGYYNYAEGNVKADPLIDEQLSKDIYWRVLVMLINEAVEALYLNVADRDGIDKAMTKGVNYPKGLLAWADDVGLDEILGTLDRLYHVYGEDRYRASRLMRQMVKEEKKFYS